MQHPNHPPGGGAPSFPPPPPPPRPPSLPPGWVHATDPASGRPYYVNSSTGETSWTPPPYFPPPPPPPPPRAMMQPPPPPHHVPQQNHNFHNDQPQMTRPSDQPVVAQPFIPHNMPMQSNYSHSQQYPPNQMQKMNTQPFHNNQTIPPNPHIPMPPQTEAQNNITHGSSSGLGPPAATAPAPGLVKCSYLKCAAEVIARTKSYDCVRVVMGIPSVEKHDQGGPSPSNSNTNNAAVADKAVVGGSDGKPQQSNPSAVAAADEGEAVTKDTTDATNKTSTTSSLNTLENHDQGTSSPSTSNSNTTVAVDKALVDGSDGTPQQSNPSAMAAADEVEAVTKDTTDATNSTNATSRSNTLANHNQGTPSSSRSNSNNDAVVVDKALVDGSDGTPQQSNPSPVVAADEGGVVTKDTTDTTNSTNTTSSSNTLEKHDQGTPSSSTSNSNDTTTVDRALIDGSDETPDQSNPSAVAAADEGGVASKDTTDATNSTNTTPSSNTTSDRIQRRKERNRKRKAFRKQQKMTPQSTRVTTTNFDRLSKSTPLSITRSIVHVKPLIVLDLNGILCHRVRQKIQPSKTKSITKFRPSLGNISRTDVIPRSDIDDFLTFLHKHFCLAVWTSATRKTANHLIRMLFPPYVRTRLIFVWSRNFCDLVANSELESSTSGGGDDGKSPQLDGKEEESKSEENKKRKNNDGTASDLEIKGTTGTESKEEKNVPYKKLSHDEVTAVKSLSKVWSAYPLWDATNTILLDDSPEKCPSQFRGNALHPPPICGTITTTDSDNNMIDLPEEDAEDGTVKAGGESDKADGDSSSTTDDDEVNQRIQRDFFKLLASHWAQPATSPEDILTSFLEENAKVHNMGWEVSSCNNAKS